MDSLLEKIEFRNKNKVNLVQTWYKPEVFRSSLLEALATALLSIMMITEVFRFIY